MRDMLALLMLPLAPQAMFSATVTALRLTGTTLSFESMRRQRKALSTTSATGRICASHGMGP